MTRNETLIELRDVTCRRRRQGGGVETALEGVSLRLRAGENLVVLGAGGAGKTTLASVLAGVIAPTEGEVVRGAALERRDAATLPLGLIAQNPEDTFTSPVVREEMGLVLQNLDWDDAELDRAVDAMLAEVGLEEYAASHPALLSGGQKQLLAAASIVIADPHLLVLDEPLSGIESSSSSSLTPGPGSYGSGPYCVELQIRNTVEAADTGVPVSVAGSPAGSG